MPSTAAHPAACYGFGNHSHNLIANELVLDARRMCMVIANSSFSFFIIFLFLFVFSLIDPFFHFIFFCVFLFRSGRNWLRSERTLQRPHSTSQRLGSSNGNSSRGNIVYNNSKSHIFWKTCARGPHFRKVLFVAAQYTLHIFISKSSSASSGRSCFLRIWAENFCI